MVSFPLVFIIFMRTLTINDLSKLPQAVREADAEGLTVRAFPLRHWYPSSAFTPRAENVGRVL
jgi:hypothetical protein